jgi:hypothetical protein
MAATANRCEACGRTGGGVPWTKLFPGHDRLLLDAGCSRRWADSADDAETSAEARLYDLALRLGAEVWRTTDRTLWFRRPRLVRPQAQSLMEWGARLAALSRRSMARLARGKKAGSSPAVQRDLFPASTRRLHEEKEGRVARGSRGRTADSGVGPQARDPVREKRT